MRKSLFLGVVAVLLPATAVCQKVPPVSPVTKAAPVVRITQTQATTVALAQVRTDLAKGSLQAWAPARSDGGGAIPPTSVAVAGVVYNATGGTNGIYVVGLTAPNTTGCVRVIVDAGTGAVVGASQIATWDWGNAPAYWKQGLNSPPPAMPR